MIYNRAERALNKLIREIKVLEAQLKKMPPGGISCARNGTSYKWYHCMGKIVKYIPKREKEFAQKLAYKRYLTLQLKRFRTEEKAIKSYLKIHNQNIGQKETDLLTHPEYQKLLEPYVVNTDEQARLWMTAIPPNTAVHPEHLIHHTDVGNVMRSKAESMIETALLKHKIPFRYEETMRFGDELVCPDFVTIHPGTGEIILWEHSGKLDEQGYIDRFLSKLRTYLENKYIPFVNFIITCETSEKPLTTEQIEDVIDLMYD